jgi:hypothetical protein
VNMIRHNHERVKPIKPAHSLTINESVHNHTSNA